MPQFDTFSFMAQLFWVLLLFSLLYSSLAYYILPAVAITLKVRRRKLSLVSSSSSNDSIVSSSDFVIFLHSINFTDIIIQRDSGSSTGQNLKINNFHSTRLAFIDYCNNFTVKVQSVITT